jgi:leucyl-tRNA synthetase
LQRCGYLSVKEPFNNLMTQGMICHETYQSTDGVWLLPEEVKKTKSGEFISAYDGSVVKKGRSEKMSKSKKNVVDPEVIISEYGADTARLFMLSDSPPDRDLDWTESGVEGAWRYINRLWRMVSEPKIPLGGTKAPAPKSLTPDMEIIQRAVHQTIYNVGEDIERFRFNKAIARIRELTNKLDAMTAEDVGGAWMYTFGMEIVIRLIAPIIPHIAEEMWHKLGHATLVTDTAWPEYDKLMLVENTVTVGIQVNGKIRGTVNLPTGCDQATAEKIGLALGPVMKAIGTKEVRKIIFVPNRILNVVL